MPRHSLIPLLLLCSCLFVGAQSSDRDQLPNFEFPDGKSREEFVSKGVILVYGDSSCQACQQAQGFLQLRHQRWRDWGFPLVYIALDGDQKNLQQNFGTTPWALYCDEKSWDSPWVSQANIHAIPTLLALDRNLNQLYEAASVAQMDLWLIKNKSVFNSSLVE